MSFSLIARADQGGLGTQTWEMARHLRPAKILVVDLGPNGRGASRLERYDGLGAEVRVCAGNPKPKHLDWLCAGMISVYTAEGTYGDALPYYAAVNKVRLVIHANPELWSERYRDATTKVVTPTDWEAHRVPGSMVMPMPVDRERLPFRHRTQARTFWHPAAPAMADRNGTDILLGALGMIPAHARVVITGATGRGREYCTGRVTVELRTAERENYWDGYDEADVLVLPRRYGGLSLPVQEALSSGMPVVMLETGPYTVGTGGVVAVPTSSSSDLPMKGGIFAVWDARPEALAGALGALASDDGLVSALSLAADVSAELLSWDHWKGPWRALLDSPLGEQYPV